MQDTQPDNNQHEILTGWKVIAQYLGRGIRTVQRYERELGLPVRRFGEHRGSIVATKSDLDSWLRSRPKRDSSDGGKHQPSQIQLSSILETRLREQSRLRTEMKALRKEVKENIRKIRESILKVREELHETRKRQDAIAKAVERYSKIVEYGSKRVGKQKPN